MNAEIKKRSKVKGKYLKMYICPEKFSSLRSLRLSLSLGTYASAKLHDSRTSRVILLKGWSLCTPRLEQHRLSSGKNPRKSFLPFSVSAKRRRHFPRGTNLSFFRFPSYSSSLIYFTLYPLLLTLSFFLLVPR